MDSVEVAAPLSFLLPDDAKFGPAMTVLTNKQKLFVLACLDFGCNVNHSRAAMLAGYQGGPDVTKVKGHYLAHDPKIQAAFLEEAGKRLQAGTIAATALLIETMADKSQETKDRLKAAQMVLDRGGLHAMSEHKVVVNHTDDRASKLLRLAELARAAGQDPREVLGDLADITDVDYEVVTKKVSREALIEEKNG